MKYAHQYTQEVQDSAEWSDERPVDAGRESLDDDDAALAGDGESDHSSDCYLSSESHSGSSTGETSSGDPEQEEADIDADDREECRDMCYPDAGEDAPTLKDTGRRTVMVLSGLLAMLLINFGYQLSLFLRASRDGAGPFQGSVGSSQSHVGRDVGEKTSQRHRRETKVRKNGDSEEYRMPKHPGRIYTHAALSSRNYRAGGVLSDDMLGRYEEDGVLVIRNLISPKLLARVDLASAMLVDRGAEGRKTKKKKKGQQFHMVENSAIFHGVPPPKDQHLCAGTNADETCEVDANNNTDTILSSFRDLAMYSKIPRVAASLLRLDELRAGGEKNLKSSRRQKIQHSKGESEAVNLRICRDIFLTKDDDPYACGWHVDDVGFWPAVAASPGVNAWIAFDDMPWPWSGNTANKVPPESGPSPVATLALSLGSHRAPWRDKAYEVTGSVHTDPSEGYASAADLIKRRSGSGTCNIQTSAPDLHASLEENKVLYDLKRGDVVFHDRFLFHRTVTTHEYVQMTQGTSAQERGSHKSDKIFRRYSIRYAPGTAVVPPGYGVELSVLHDYDNANRTLDDIVERSGPWYPKAWPHVLKNKPLESSVESEEIEGLSKLVHVDLPAAQRLQKERKKEIQRLLSMRGGE